MTSILRKVKSLPALIKRQKSSQKLGKLCNSVPLSYGQPPSQRRNWLFLEQCYLLERLADYFVTLHGENEEDNRGQRRVWYWANDFDEEYPMTYHIDDDSTISGSDPRPTTSSTATPMNDQQSIFGTIMNTFLLSSYHHFNIVYDPDLSFPMQTHDSIDEEIIDSQKDPIDGLDKCHD
jgi:hypothetical protein